VKATAHTPERPAPAPDSPEGTPAPLSVKVLTTLAIVAALYIAQTLIVPVLIGVFVSYALNPVVDALTRWRLPRTFASLIVVATVIGTMGWLGYQLSDEAMAAVKSVPSVTKRLRETVEKMTGRGPSVVQELQQAADAVASAADGGQPRRRAGEPMPVAVVEPTIDVKQYVWMGWWGLVALGGQILLVTFLTFFMLASGDLYRRKIVRLAGTRLSDRRVTVEILDEVGGQVSRFLLHQVVTGMTVGVATWLAFWWLGVDYPGLWGVAAGVMNSVPYFGPTVVAIAAFVAAFLQFGTLSQAALVSSASLVITTIEGMVVTPMLVSRLARMNAVAVFLGLLFWGWLWGVPGMLLAVPLLMAVKAVADRVADLKPVAELLGD
jgi:predicted PurR-regulated permease PerM